MNGNRFTVGLCLALCLLLCGFALPPAAATTVVTTNEGIVDPPFNTGTLCGGACAENNESPQQSVLDGRTVIDWNLTGVTTFLHVAPTLGPRSAPLGSRALAMMHVAMADAVFSIHPVYKPYGVWLRGHGSADQLAAAATAAHGVLVRLFPSEQAALDAALADSLSQVPDGRRKEEGIAVGVEVAARIVALRAND